MAEEVADWKRADEAHLRTYSGVMRMALISVVGTVAVLGLMALFLL